eukprot:TRINITY_DN3418_c0_g1_i1.p1 TRINITY_DN3418_c0_g1~~TRINITY_DN3418_c0_g1_i1.p1  ORF type:complete len:347 (-),score=79.68 TRINITY_DN3418_c0_g1_i1:227-1267(-)
MDDPTRSIAEAAALKRSALRPISPPPSSPRTPTQIPNVNLRPLSPRGSLPNVVSPTPTSPGFQGAGIPQRTPRTSIGLRSSPQSSGSPGWTAALERSPSQQAVTLEDVASSNTMCERCEESPSQLKCQECDQSFCADCSTFLHSKGKWLAHHILPLSSSNLATSLDSTTPSAPIPEMTSPETADQTSQLSAPVFPSVPSEPPRISYGQTTLPAYVIPQPRLNQNPIIDFSNEEVKLEPLRFAVMDDAIDTLMSACLTYLFEGIMMVHSDLGKIYLRINEDQSTLLYCTISDPNFVPSASHPMEDAKQLRVMDIVDLHETSVTSFTIFTKSNQNFVLSSGIITSCII